MVGVAELNTNHSETSLTLKIYWCFWFRIVLLELALRTLYAVTNKGILNGLSICMGLPAKALKVRLAI